MAHNETSQVTIFKIKKKVFALKIITYRNQIRKAKQKVQCNTQSNIIKLRSKEVYSKQV